MSGNRPRLLTDQPLWRLIVALHDAETVAGPDSESALLLREAIEIKLRRQHVERPAQHLIGRADEVRQGIPLSLAEARMVAAQIRQVHHGNSEYWSWVIEKLCNRLEELERSP